MLAYVFVLALDNRRTRLLLPMPLGLSPSVKARGRFADMTAVAIEASERVEECGQAGVVC
jgi:hypothetical protein